VDAHCDLRIAYEDFVYSHASIAYNGLQEIAAIKKLVQIGVRDFSKAEMEYSKNSNGRIVTYFYEQIKNRQFEGESWKNICDEIIDQLPQNVHISFDIDGLDPKLCPHTGTPVQGGFETDQVNYLFSRIKKTGRTIVGFDLVEVGVDELEWDANVGARQLWKLCNLMVD
jgi:agmatinase